MKDINFIYLRSPVTSSEEFQDQQRKIFLNSLNKNNDFNFTKNGKNIFFIETGGTEEKFKKIYKKYKAPYFILATNANNSLPAALEIATFLKSKKEKFILYHGTAKEIREKLLTKMSKNISKNSNKIKAKNLLKNMRFGVIGKPSDWLIASDTNYKKVKEKFKATIIDISIDELLTFYKKASPNNLLKSYEKYLNSKVNLSTLKGALKLYVSIKQIIKKYKLNGITIRCFDLLDKITNTSCLALAMLNEEGYIATCEGDVPTMLTMAMVKNLYDQSSFQVNPSYINKEKHFAYFAHCTLPLDMTKSFKFDTHFESGIGVGIKGKLRRDYVTIFKINANLEDYEIFVGKITKNLKKKNLCRTQIKVSFKEDISSMLASPNGNHLVCFYGNNKSDLIDKLS